MFSRQPATAETEFYPRNVHVKSVVHKTALE